MSQSQQSTCGHQAQQRLNVNEGRKMIMTRPILRSAMMRHHSRHDSFFRSLAMSELSGTRILAFVGDDYEDLELWYPKLRMEEAGAKVTVAGQEAHKKYIGKNGYPCVSDADVATMNEADFDGVLVPGGWMPDKLRRDAKVLSLVAAFEASKKLIASICHGPWIDISAKVVRGYKYTSTPALKDDLINAGAIWSDQEVMIDRHHVSSRRPSDLPAFCKGMLQVLAAQKK